MPTPWDRAESWRSSGSGSKTTVRTSTDGSASDLARGSGGSRPALVSFKQASAGGSAALWRTSSVVTDTVEKSMGYRSLKQLCGRDFILPAELSNERPLGQGGFGVVSRCTWSPPPGPDFSPRPPVEVAVKRLKPHVLESEGDVVDFIQECRTLLHMRHPSIVRFIGMGCVEDSSPEAEWRTIFLVQEYADAGSIKTLMLKQMMTRKPLYAYVDALRWCRQIAQGLQQLHERNPMLIHRDFKAENIFLYSRPDGQGLDAKIGDFGLHKLIKLPGQAEWPFAHIREYSTHGQAAALKALAAGPPAGAPAQPAPAGAAAPSHSLEVRPGGDRSDSVSSLEGGDAAPAQPPAGDGPSAEAPPPPPAVQPAAGAPPEEPARQSKKYAMTGQTGAYIYMAPEVLMGQPYNEKVDVFSFGIVLFELFQRRLLLADMMNTQEWDESEDFAYKVAAGHRPPFPVAVLPPIRALVERCWRGLPELRPTMGEVVRALQEIEESGAAEAMDAAEHSPEKQGCACALM